MRPQPDKIVVVGAAGNPVAANVWKSVVGGPPSYYPYSQAVTVDINRNQSPTVVGDCSDDATVSSIGRHFNNGSKPAAIVFECVPTLGAIDRYIGKLKNLYPNSPIIIIGTTPSDMYKVLDLYGNDALFSEFALKHRRILIFGNDELCSSKESWERYRQSQPKLDSYLNKVGVNSGANLEQLNASLGGFAALVEEIIKTRIGEAFCNTFFLHDKGLSHEEGIVASVSDKPKTLTYQYLQDKVNTYSPGHFRKNLSEGAATSQIRQLRAILVGKDAVDSITQEDIDHISHLASMTFVRSLPGEGSNTETKRILKEIIWDLVIMPEIKKTQSENAHGVGADAASAGGGAAAPPTSPPAAAAAAASAADAGGGAGAAVHPPARGGGARGRVLPCLKGLFGIRPSKKASADPKGYSGPHK